MHGAMYQRTMHNNGRVLEGRNQQPSTLPPLGFHDRHQGRTRILCVPAFFGRARSTKRHGPIPCLLLSSCPRSSLSNRRAVSQHIFHQNLFALLVRHGGYSPVRSDVTSDCRTTYLTYTEILSTVNIPHCLNCLTRNLTVATGPVGLVGTPSEGEKGGGPEGDGAGDEHEARTLPRNWRGGIVRRAGRRRRSYSTSSSRPPATSASMRSSC